MPVALALFDGCELLRQQAGVLAGAVVLVRAVVDALVGVHMPLGVAQHYLKLDC